ncbi:MAG: hypothetical protein HYX38_35775 [Rhodospirillales bacterium]|nr:hypothetical protein [Rhodospirillales bacterium]
MTMLRILARLCAVTGGLMLGGCHYTEEQKWSVCCVLYVQADQSATDEARTVIGWHRQSDYDGNGRGGQGSYSEGKTFYSDKDEKIRSDVAAFLDDDPGKRATDYFVGLGMACSSYSSASGTDGTRCEISLPVRVICGPTYRFLPGTTPIPEQMKRPLVGVLHVSVDLPTGRALKTSSRVDPIPGEQLCHR